LGILIYTRGLVRGKAGETSDAVGLFAVVLESAPTSIFSLPSRFSSSALRSALTDSAPPIFASISLMVFQSCSSRNLPAF